MPAEIGNVDRFVEIPHFLGRFEESSLFPGPNNIKVYLLIMSLWRFRSVGGINEGLDPGCYPRVSAVLIHLKNQIGIFTHGILKILHKEGIGTTAVVRNEYWIQALVVPGKYHCSEQILFILPNQVRVVRGQPDRIQGQQVEWNRQHSQFPQFLGNI